MLFYGRQTIPFVGRVLSTWFMISSKVHFRVCFSIDEKHDWLPRYSSSTTLTNEPNAWRRLFPWLEDRFRLRLYWLVQLLTKRRWSPGPPDSRWSFSCSLRRYWWEGNTPAMVEIVKVCFDIAAEDWRLIYLATSIGEGPRQTRVSDITRQGEWEKKNT